MSRPSRTLRLDPLPGWMRDPPLRAVVAALAGAGGWPRFVGGCVRDAILDRPVNDIDLATPLAPDRVIAALRQAGLGVAPTGLKHGTVTAIADGRPFEVTTLRVDVETDGRHAVVAFTDDWQADAARRDFTMNALSAEPDGTVHDHFGGIDDARAGHIRFVGEPAARIAEDALRILRFYRFQAHYGRDEPDAAALAACRAAAASLARLSGERIRAELLKLLAAADPVPAWRLMAEAGVAREAIGTDGDLARLAGLVAVDPERDPVRRLAAVLDRDPAPVVARLKLSNADRDRLTRLHGAALADPPAPPAIRLLLYRHGRQETIDRILLGWAADPARPGCAEAVALARTLPAPVFPLRGRDAVALGLSGPAIGEALARVEAWWIARDFTPDRAACLMELARIVDR